MEPVSDRHSIRLDGYDYTTNAAYFITICTRHKEHRFDHIIDGVMPLNEAGLMVEERIRFIPVRFPGTLIDSYIVMPNHVHFIITLLGYHPVDKLIPNGESGSDGVSISNDKSVPDGCCL